MFEYLYRDAGNYKAHGQLLLKGSADAAAVSAVRDRLDSREWFVAEQIGIPPLYGMLYELSGGPTVDDHGWHEFVDLRRASAEEIRSTTPWGTLEDLIEAIRAVQHWRPDLSPNWN